MLLRVLIRRHVLFPGESGLSAAAAGALVDAPPAVLRGAIERLLADGVIEYDAGSGGMRLSRDTLGDLRPPALLH